MTEQERYVERVKKAFEDFLTSDFIDYNPYSVDDETIISDAIERSNINYDGGRLKWMQSFASIYTIEGGKELEYNGTNFMSLFLKASGGKTLRMNYSDFRYKTSFYNGEYDFSHFGNKFDECNAHYTNLVDDRMALPESLSNHVGQRILIGYDFYTINYRGSYRTCYRLYSLPDDNLQAATIIRKQILRAQAFALLLAAKYPALCLPSYNGERIEPYMYEITKAVGAEYTSKLRVKLSQVEQALREHGLTYEHNI